MTDEKIDSKDIMIAGPSVIIAVGILWYPKALAESIRFADGWVVILISGTLSVLFAWVITKLATNFPNQSFLSYASSLISRPIAYFFTIMFALQGLLLTAFEVRSITIISEQYLIERTPFEVVALTFLLVVIYAVSGSRAAIFRLNALYLPVIFLITGVLVFFSLNFMEMDNLLPVLTTDIKGYAQGTVSSIFNYYAGMTILFFYVTYVTDIKKAPKMAAIGMSWVMVLYLAIYITCIAVFGQPTTEVISLPLVELAKSVEIPGGFFERMDSIFFVIWVTAIFTTAVIAYDICVLALHQIFPKMNKKILVMSLAPLIYFISLMPKGYLENMRFGNDVGVFNAGLTLVATILLWIMYFIRGGKKHGK